MRILKWILTIVLVAIILVLFAELDTNDHSFTPSGRDQQYQNLR